MVLLDLTTLEVGTDIGSNSLACGRHAAHTTCVLLMKVRHATWKVTHFWHIIPYFIVISARSLIVIARLSWGPTAGLGYAAR